MRPCPDCGHGNPDDIPRCEECANELKAEALAPKLEAGIVEQEAEPAGDETDCEPTSANETCLCLSCLYPHQPEAAFCKRCGAPVGSIAAIGPLERLYAEGFVYRKAAEGRPSLIVLFGIWLLFLPPAVLSLGMLAWGVHLEIRFGQNLFSNWIYICSGGLSLAMLYRVTKNFITLPKLKYASLDDDESGES